MLSKSQARLFFLSGTLVFSCVFLFLTVDTMGKVPEQTNATHLSEEVKHGKELFDKNNCMGCHTILGEGAYYAPELTKTYQKRGPEWLKVFLKDPQAMYPNERKMVQYDFSEKEIDDLIAFFKWIGEMDLNGFPPEPDLASQVSATETQTVDSSLEAPTAFTALCLACHTLNGQGAQVGPTLNGIGNKFDVAYLDAWLKDPAAMKPGTTMPKLPLSDSDRKAIAQFLAEQK